MFFLFFFIAFISIFHPTEIHSTIPLFSIALFVFIFITATEQTVVFVKPSSSWPNSTPYSVCLTGMPDIRICRKVYPLLPGMFEEIHSSKSNCNETLLLTELKPDCVCVVKFWKAGSWWCSISQGRNCCNLFKSICSLVLSRKYF